MPLLLPEHQHALDASPEVPARVADPATGGRAVLLKSDDFDWIRGIVDDEPDAPRLTDPRKQQDYALVPEGRYERYKAFFEEGPLSPEERAYLLREAGRRAGWDDPALDVYEEYRR